jgi:hypothetical protein
MLTSLHLPGRRSWEQLALIILHVEPISSSPHLRSFDGFTPGGVSQSVDFIRDVTMEGKNDMLEERCPWKRPWAAASDDEEIHAGSNHRRTSYIVGSSNLSPIVSQCRLSFKILSSEAAR